MIIPSKLGKGKNMSIPKAALVYFFEDKYEECKDCLGAWYLCSGNLDDFHNIVDIAGAMQCSFYTHTLVLNCMRGSSYWESCGTVPGWGNRRANVYRPSRSGELYYKMCLKNRKEIKKC